MNSINILKKRLNIEPCEQPKTIEVVNSIPLDAKIPVKVGEDVKLISLADLLSQGVDSPKVSNGIKVLSETNVSLSEAIRFVPESERKIGMIISFLDYDTKEWRIFQFTGTSLRVFEDCKRWKEITAKETIKEVENSVIKGIYPNEEELLKKRPYGKKGDIALIGTRYKEMKIAYWCTKRDKWIFFIDPLDGVTRYDILGFRDVEIDLMCDGTNACVAPQIFRRGTNLYGIDQYGREYLVGSVLDNTTSYNVDVEKSPFVDIFISHSNPIPAGTEVTVTSRPKEGYTIANLADSTGFSTEGSSYTFRIYEDRKVSAIALKNVVCEPVKEVVREVEVPGPERIVNVNRVSIFLLDFTNASIEAVGDTEKKSDSVVIGNNRASAIIRHNLGRDKKFVKWIVNGEERTDASLNLVVTDDTWVQLVFTDAVVEPSKFTITSRSSNVDMGVVGPAVYSSVRQGETVVFQANPKPGHRLVRWEKGGAVVGGSESVLSIVVDGNAEYVAVFEAIPVVQPDRPADVITYRYEVEHTNPGRIDIPHPWNNVTTCIDYKVWKIKLVNGREESRELTQDYTSNKDKNRFCTLHNDSITLDLVVGVGGTEVRKSIPIVVNRLPEPARPAERVRVTYTKNHEGLTLGKTEELADKGSRVYNTALIPSDEYVFDGWFIGGTRISTSLALDYVATESVTIEARMSQKPVVVPDGPRPFKLKAPVGIEHTLSDNDTRIDLANSCYIDGGDGQGFRFTLQLADDSEEYISVLDQNIPGISVSTFDTNKKEILIEMDCRDYRGFVGKILELVDRLGRKILVFLGIGKNRPATPPSDDITIVVRDNPEEGGVSSVEDYVEPSVGGIGGTTTTQADKDRFPSSLRSIGGIWYSPGYISPEKGDGLIFQGHYHRDSIQDYTQLVVVTTNKGEYSVNVNDMVAGLELAPYQLIDGEHPTQMKFVFRDRTELVIS